MFLYNIMQIWGIIGAGQLPEVTYKTSSIMPGLDSSVTCRPVLIAVKITYISVELKYSKLSGSNFLLILGNNGYQPTQHGKLNAKKLIQIRLLVVSCTENDILSYRFFQVPVFCSLNSKLKLTVHAVSV